MQRLEFRAMGCQMLAVLDSETPQASARLAQVPTWFAEWEQHLSRFREDSELARLNRQAGSPVQVSHVLWEVVLLARRAARWSDGLVTPRLLNELEAAGYDRTFEAIDRHHAATPLPSRQESVAKSAGPSTNGDPRAIETDDRTHSIRVLAGVRLDLGGIAKGWAADQAAMRLAIHGPSLVDAGGDIAISGPQADGQRWPVGVADPQAPHRNL